MMCRVAENHDSCRTLAFTKQYMIVNRHIAKLLGIVIPDGMTEDEEISFLYMMAKTEFVQSQKNPLPENLNIVFSVWDGWECPNPFNLPTAHVRLKAGNVFEIPENAYECPKFCGACVYSEKSCWSLQHGESVVFNQH